MKWKGKNRLAEIRDGRGGRLSRFDFAFLAGQLYRREDGDAISLWHIRD